MIVERPAGLRPATREGRTRIDVQALKERWRLEELAARYGVQLRGRGHRLYGRCPFHEDRTPSLVVYPATQSFFCFGCRAWGDVIDWVARLEGLEFLEACRFLGADLPAPHSVRPRAALPPRVFEDGLPGWALRTLRVAADIYHTALPRSPEALAYLRSRGIGARAVHWAWLGYATGSDLSRGLVQHAVPLGAAHELGLLNDRGREVLRGRITVPVIVGGQVVTMTGRAVSPTLDRRYLDLPLPPHLLGGDLVHGERRVVLTEGVTDYLVALAWGVPAITTMGTHASEEVRAEVLSATEDAELVPLALDNDEGGHAAADDWLNWLGPKAAPVTWPPGIGDLGELGQRPDGRAVFDRLLASAEARWRETASLAHRRGEARMVADPLPDTTQEEGTSR